MAGIGHNRGPEMTGLSWRRTCWQAARERLVPHLPVEVVRLRVRRAAELGLDYRSYAGVRSTTGHDIVAFLFSQNALRPDAGGMIAQALREKLAGLKAVDRVALVRGGLPILQMNPEAFDRMAQAPEPFAGFGAARAAIRAAIGTLPSDRVVLIASDAPWEAEWGAAGRLAAVLPAERYFARA